MFVVLWMFCTSHVEEASHQIYLWVQIKVLYISNFCGPSMDVVLATRRTNHKHKITMKNEEKNGAALRPTGELQPSPSMGTGVILQTLVLSLCGMLGPLQDWYAFQKLLGKGAVGYFAPYSIWTALKKERQLWSRSWDSGFVIFAIGYSYLYFFYVIISDH